MAASAARASDTGMRAAAPAVRISRARRSTTASLWVHRLRSASIRRPASRLDPGRPQPRADRARRLRRGRSGRAPGCKSRPGRWRRRRRATRRSRRRASRCSSGTIGARASQAWMRGPGAVHQRRRDGDAGGAGEAEAPRRDPADPLPFDLDRAPRLGAGADHLLGELEVDAGAVAVAHLVDDRAGPRRFALERGAHAVGQRPDLGVGQAPRRRDQRAERGRDRRWRARFPTPPRSCAACNFRRRRPGPASAPRPLRPC